MAYLMTHFWPGATEEQYRATVAVVHPAGGLPQGRALSRCRGDGGRDAHRSGVGSRESADPVRERGVDAEQPVDGGFHREEPDERLAEVSNLQTA